MCLGCGKEFRRLIQLGLSAALMLCCFAGNAESPLPTRLPPVSDSVIAPDFELPGEDGTVYRLSDFRGQVVVLSFWATWCPPCRYEMPSMERAWQQLKDKDVMFLGVNVGEDADTIFEFTGTYPISFPVPMDIDGEVSKLYPLQGLPTTYVIDPEGRVAFRAVGSREWDDPSVMQRILNLRSR